MMEPINEACGVFGVYYPQKKVDAAGLVYYGLYALQHRGQESSGMTVHEDGCMRTYKQVGLVGDVFTHEVLEELGRGNIAIGHVRYSTTGSCGQINAQPIVIENEKLKMSLAHNGNLVNAEELRKKLTPENTPILSTSDSELIAHTIARETYETGNIEVAIEKAMNQIDGAYSLTIMTPEKLIAVRDEHGFRPLCYGRMRDDGYVVASESCALSAVGAEFVRDVDPGEIIVFDEEGVHSITTHCHKVAESLCVFEFIYFARPDSIIEGSSVHQARLRAGAYLALEYPAQADVVIGVPDSGIDAAIGFSRQSGIPYGIGLIKNKYIGRTFIQPEPQSRRDQVDIKLSPVEATVKGKRVILIDDSIVRGTTSAQIVHKLRQAGATEVHLRISAPPFLYPCFYGTDIDSSEKLIAYNHTIEEIQKILNVDSLGYLSIPDAVRIAEKHEGKGFCTACFSGVYTTRIPQETSKEKFENQ